jgi:hypothetical protein
MRAYTDGEAIKLFDQIMRAMFPRFIFYSADYPEKSDQISSFPIHTDIKFRILISCIKFLSKCMCPRCLSLKRNITQVASKRDMRNRVKLQRVDSEGRRYNVEQVRKLLFEKGIAITSVFVDRILEATSGVPTRVCVPILPSVVISNYFMMN